MKFSDQWKKLPANSRNAERKSDTDPNVVGLNEPLIQDEDGKKRWGRVYVRKKPRMGDVAH